MTYAYINTVIEDIKSFRIRKIRWAINEIYKEGKEPTLYKVQLKAGFGGSKNNMDVRSLINIELERNDKYG